MLSFTNAGVIDVTGGNIQSGMTVTVNDGKIIAIEKNSAVPAGSSVIDLGGKYLMPALIDAHTHFSGSSRFDRPGSGVPENTYDYAEVREGFLQWGVLTVRTCGDICPSILEFRDAAAAGQTQTAPRILAAGPWVQGKDGHPAYTVYMANPDIIENAAICVDDNSDLDAIVHEVKDRNVDWLKIFYGHINKMNYPVPVPRMSKETLCRLVSLGHRYGMKVMVHIDGFGEMKDAAEAGADSIEHVIADGADDMDYSDEFIAFLAEKQIPIDPTMICILRFDDKVSGASPVYENLKAIVRRMHDAGVKLMAGCDSGIPFVPFGESLHDELACLVEAGFTPAEAIRAATAVNAEVLGISDRLGTIEVGKTADLLVLEKNPLEDIANTKSIQMITQGGRIIDDRFTGV